MARHGIPTADFRVFEDPAACVAWLESSEAVYPLVVKADGLAAGKGVVMARDLGEAAAAAESMLSGAAFGAAGRRIVVEETLVGREASFFVLADGERFVELEPCQDYKRAEDADAGPNTGGMGTYSPSAHLSPEHRRALRDGVVRPTLSGLAAEGRPYRGVLFVGAMLTEQGLRILEFNVRFGDPETQVLIPRLDGDWVPLLAAAAEGSLDGVVPRWRTGASVCVVMASGGYPAAYRKGIPIYGIEDAETVPGVVVFHAGTELANGRLVTNGGRVLGVTATGATVDEAARRAYDGVARIHWDGEHHRADIARDAAGAA
jgi:phosphoribosylamine--glycine ligase